MYPDGYTFRDSYPAIYQIDRAEVVTLEVYQSGALVTPSAGALSLQAPGGEVIESPAVSIVAGVATATLAALATIGEGYREKWDLTIAGVVYTKYRDAAVCKSPLRLPVTDADLTQRYPDLAQNLGTSATSFQTFLDAAWGTILRRIRSGGELPYAVVQASALYDATVHLTLHQVYMWWYGQTGGEHLKTMADYHMTRYDEAWPRIAYEVDRDQDGVSDGRDQTGPSKAAIVYPSPSPHRRRGWSRAW